MTPDARGSGGRTAVAVAALAFVAFTVYLPALSTGFSADDFFILAKIKALDGLAHPLAYFGFGFFDYYRPVPFLSQALDWQIWGPNPFGFHLQNLLLHGGCTVFVFLIGRRVFDSSAAIASALLFALHPASHEAVYWIAARFDLMATFFTLVSIWCLSDDRRRVRAAGVLTFAIALLSKESAISLLLIAPAWDVLVTKRDVGAVVRRLLPLLAVVAAYAIVRSLGADLDAAGGARRLPKLLMAAAMLTAILWIAWARERPQGIVSRNPRAWWLMTGAVALALGGLLWWPATSGSLATSLGFAGYAAFYLVSPVLFPSPPPEWFNPVVARDAVPGLLVVTLVLAALARFGSTVSRHGAAVFLCVFVAGALLPVSSMSGGLRYLYLATAGVSLFAGWLLQQASGARRLALAGLLILVLALSIPQLMRAGRAWRTGSDMIRDGITLMASRLEPCGSKDVVLLTAPVGIGGVYSNFYYETFEVLTGCSPKLFSTLLRVVGSDVHVEVRTRSRDVVELRVPNYRGNIVASQDLSNFAVRVSAGLARTIETPLGRLEIFPEDGTQVFRLTLLEPARAASRFYYSDGAVRRAGD